MTDDHWSRVREVFDRAVELDRASRAALLGSEPPAVRSEVERLLRADAAASRVLESGIDLLQEQGGAWSASLAPGQEIGGYRLVRAIGSGGMGVVFEAEQRDPRRRVALKTVRAEFFTPDLARRFANEVAMLARLEHPGIARIYATGTFERGGEPCPYYTMELVEGARSVVAYAEEHDLDLRTRLALFLRACDAVDFGHRKGVIHRDLKPGNLLVDPRGELKVIDFGLARLEDPASFGATPAHTRAGLVFGTLPYMSPEHASGRPLEIDTQSDVYSLGCILCELAAGRTPHDLYDVPIRTALERIESEDPRLPDGLPRELSWIVLRAVQRDRSRRYARVAELAGDVGRFLRREPVRAAPPGRWYPLRAYARRHRRALAAAATVVLGLALGLVRAETEARAARRARDEAERETRVSNEVSSFLASLFTGMHAFSEGGGARVSDVLSIAADRLSGMEGRDARAILAGLVGQGYLNLGDIQAAGPYLSDAVELGAEVFAPDSIHRLRNENVLADWLEQTGRYAESRTLSADVLRRGAGVLERHDRFYARYNLAVCDLRLGRYREAEEVFRGLLEQELETRESWTRAINLTHRVAAALSYQRRHGEARAAYEEALAMCARIPEGNELYAATVRMDLAQLLLESGELGEAERLLGLARAAFAEHGAPASSHVLAALTLASLRIEKGELDAAARDFAEARRHAAGAAEGTRLDVFLGLVDARLRAAGGDVDGAREVARSALATAVAVGGPASHLAAGAFDALAEIAERSGGAGARAEVLRRAWRRFRDARGADDALTLHRLELCARALVDAGRAAEAAPLALELAESTPRDDPARAARLELRRQLVPGSSSAIAGEGRE